MKYVIELNQQLEEIYIESAKMLGVSTKDVLELVLNEYVTNIFKTTKSPLN